MALPTIEGFMIHTLKTLGDGKSHNKPEIIEYAAKAARLDQDDMAIRNRANALLYKTYIHWALLYMTKAGLVEQLSVESYKITQDGLKLLATNPEVINQKTLLSYPAYQQYQSLKRKIMTTETKQPQEPEHVVITDPMTRISEAADEINQALKTEILSVLKNVKPFFFEKVVVDLIEKMGYSSGHEGSSKAFCMGSDGGIDGVIEEDRLGLDKIYIQAKRWSNNIGRPDLQQFAGTLIGKHAHKGVFITTSDFSKDARDFVKDSGSNISLINGEKLVSLMVEFGLGISLQKRIDILKVDHDYFNDEEY